MVNLLPNLPYPLVLASASPRRQEMIQHLGISPIIAPADIDETIPENLTNPEDVAPYLAKKKAMHIAQSYPNHIVIGSDTVVHYNNRFLEKPSDQAQATEFLQTLSGQTHAVVSGVALVCNDTVHSFAETTQVSFSELSPDMIQHYITTYNPYDKAGGYGIQDWIGIVGIHRILGCYQNVIGFPLPRFVTEIQRFTTLV